MREIRDEGLFLLLAAHGIGGPRSQAMIWCNGRGVEKAYAQEKGSGNH